MKEATARALSTLDPEDLKDLCREVPETLATGHGMKPRRRVFGPADLWQIRRTARYRIQRRLNQ